MKSIYIFLISVFIFTGCLNEKQIVIPNKSVEQEKKVEKKSTLTYEYIKQDRVEEKNDINNFTPGETFKIAIIYPSKIVGKYGNSVVNTVLGYLFYKNTRFEVETFDSLDENVDSIYNSFSEAKNKNYDKIIALYTPNSFSIIKNISNLMETEVYFPLIEKNEATFAPSSFIFGSISYYEQMQKLLEYSNGDNSQFYEESSIGYKLKSIYETLVPEIIVNQEIKITNNNFKDIVTNESLKHTTLMLNTPIIKSSIILSQLYAHETENGAILTTQLNFNPLLISLTQYEDRLNLILANSIEDTHSSLIELLTLMDSDIQYNWVNYSTLVGVNYMFSRNSDGLIKNEIQNSKVVYNTNIYYSTEQSFKRIEDKPLNNF